MPTRSTACRAIPGAAALALSCAVLAGCGGSGGPAQGAASTPPSGGSSSSAGNAPAHSGKLTGNFCNDFKNIGKNIPIPAASTGSLSTMVKHDGAYLSRLAAYYHKLAAEAPPQVGQEVNRIAAAYQGLAASITSGGKVSISQVEQQITSLTTSGAAGAAFKRLIVYVTTKCGPSEVSG